MFLPSLLHYKLNGLTLTKWRDEREKEYAKRYSNINFRAWISNPLGPGDCVHTRSYKEKTCCDSGTVNSANTEKRFYVVETNHVLFRRNRIHLQHTGFLNVHTRCIVWSRQTSDCNERVQSPSPVNSYVIRACCLSSLAIRGLRVMWKK